MKCQKCVARVTDLIGQFEDVAEVSISLEDAVARITSVSEKPVRIDRILEKLQVAGFATSLPEQAPHPVSTPAAAPDMNVDPLEQLRFSVSGMSCTSCAATIEKRLNRLSGINDVSVNLAGNFVQLRYCPQIIGKEVIFDAVEEAGFTPQRTQQETGPDASKKELRLLLIAVAGALPIMLLMFVPVFGRASLAISGILATFVQFTSGLDFYRSAWRSLHNHSANMDVLVSLGITAAYGYSVLAWLGLMGPNPAIFFETSAMLIMFIRFGKWLESRAKGKAGAALKKLLQLQADSAVLLDGEGEKNIQASRIQAGDLLLVRPGEKIPVDGEVIEGEAAVDEAMITGEAVPVHKEPGSEVIGATINRSGRLVIKATHIGEQSVLSRIVRLVEEAQGDKAPIQRLADRVSGIFVPAVIALSLLTFCGWYLPAGKDFLFAFQMAIAVVVIACPCALGLATPTAIMVGSSVGLERGILFKKATALENISKLQILLLDKTGTLTSGRFQVDEIIPCGDLTADELLFVSAALESGSTHPLARGIVAEAEKQQLEMSAVTQLEEIGGHGLSGIVAGKRVICGSRALMEKYSINPTIDSGIDDAPGDSVKSRIFVAVENELQGVITLSDEIKANAAIVIRQLRGLGIRPVLVTGDLKAAAQSVADAIGIAQVEAEVLPEQKLQVVKKYQRQGLLVGMVGDGINDAPALAQADVGIAIGSGTDVAKETGDLILVSGDLYDIVRGITLGRQTLRKIKQNLFWAFFYNLLGIPLAAGLFYPWFGLYLKPEFAGLAMAFSSVSVVVNSLTLRRMKYRLQGIG